MPAPMPTPHVMPTVARSNPARLLLVALIAIALVVPLAQAAADENVDVVGEVILEHADDFTAGRSQEHRVLQTDRGQYVLEGRGAEAATIGARVRVRGKRQGGTLVLADSGSVTTLSGTSTTSSTTLAEASSVGKKVVVLLMNFTDPPPPATPSPSPEPSYSPDPLASPTVPPSPTPSPSPSPTPKPPSEPWTKSFVRGLYFNNTKSVAAYYSEVSNGKLSITGDVFGYFTIPAKTTNCNYSDWAATARQMATASGINLSAYDHVVHAFGRVSACWWGGLAQVYGKYNWINGSMTPYVTMHELGHNFGAHHASTMTCTKSGSRVTISTNCTVNEYGDPFDLMGQNASGGSKQRHLQTWHRRQLGFLGSSDQQTVTKNGHYSVATAQVAGGAPRVVRIPRPSGKYYYLEFRQPYGLFDDYSSTAAVVSGVLVRIAPDSKRVQSMLLDMNPSTSGFGDAALAVGQTFTDTPNDISIKTTSINSNGAKLRIQVGPDTVPPTTPGNLTASLGADKSITLRWSAASDDLEVTGYRISRNGSVLKSVGASTLTYSDKNLVDGVTYSYSLVALDGGKNASVAATVSLQLPDSTAPGAPTNVTASQTGPRTVTLSWGPATDNGAVALYRVRRDGKLYAKTTTTTFTDTVVDGYGYRYEVRAEDVAGNLGPTVAATPTTILLPDVTSPSAPGSLSLATATTSSASLSWTAATDNVAVTGYRVSRDGALRATLAAAARSFSESGLTSGTYLYEVAAFDAAGNLGPAMSSSVSLASTDTTAPSVPQKLSGTARDGRYVELNWVASTDDRPGPIEYRVLRDGKRIATVTTTSYTDRPASAGSYNYKVRAVDGAGNKSAFSSIISVRAVTSLAPTTPANLKATALDRRYVNLGWSASSGGTGTIRYRIFRNGVRIATVTKLSYTDRPASVGTYKYKVRALDGAGNKSAFTSPVSVTAVKSVTSSPSVPANLTGQALDRRYVKLSWTASSGGSGTIHYRLFRDGVRIAKVSKLSYTDRPASVGTYSYKVRAVDGAGNKSAFTPIVKVKAVKAV